jgi:hypothetical protein
MIREQLMNKINHILSLKTFEKKVYYEEGLLQIDLIKFKKQNDTYQVFYQYQLKSEPLLEGDEAKNLYNWTSQQYLKAKEAGLSRYLAVKKQPIN